MLVIPHKIFRENVGWQMEMIIMENHQDGPTWTDMFQNTFHCLLKEKDPK